MSRARAGAERSSRSAAALETVVSTRRVSHSRPSVLHGPFHPTRTQSEKTGPRRGDQSRRVTIQGPVARKLFVLAKASHLAHLQVASYMALIAAADTLGHPGVAVLLESCLADKLAFVERTKRLISEQLTERVSHA